MTHVGGIEIVPASQLRDVEQLRPVLETAVRDSETGELLAYELEHILDTVRWSIEDPGDRQYVVATTEKDEVVGMMGLTTPDHRMRRHATSKNPGELVNAFVHTDYRRAGIGQLLISQLEKQAQERGFSELIVNSGPRYERYGWAFWRRVFGQEVATAIDYYGPGYSAPVWRKVLETTVEPPQFPAQRVGIEETEGFRRPGFTGHVYIGPEAGQGFSALLIDVNGQHPVKRMLPGTTRTYFVANGSGEFILNGELTPVKPGDFITIPPESTYSYRGTMQLLEQNISPTNSFADEKLAEPTTAELANAPSITTVTRRVTLPKDQLSALENHGGWGWEIVKDGIPVPHIPGEQLPAPDDPNYWRG